MRKASPGTCMIARLGTDFAPQQDRESDHPFRPDGCELDDLSGVGLVHHRGHAARDEVYVLDRLERRMQDMLDREMNGLQVRTDGFELLTGQLGKQLVDGRHNLRSVSWQT